MQRITRESESEAEAFLSPQEREGENPMRDPLAAIGVLSILFPFLLLGVFIATGVIDVNK